MKHLIFAVSAFVIVSLLELLVFPTTYSARLLVLAIVNFIFSFCVWAYLKMGDMDKDSVPYQRKVDLT